MARKKSDPIPNQVFVGLPWKNVRPKYEKVIRNLAKKFPLYFTIVGRDDGQDAVSLFDVIKARIESSSYAIFDATGGNANVSLEYGYAEGIDVPRAIFLSDHKASGKGAASEPIISDLTGMRRVHYKNAARLSREVSRFAADHPYTVRFENGLKKILKGASKGAKKSGRALALKLVRALDGKPQVRRPDLIQSIEAQGYGRKEAEYMLAKLHGAGLLKCTVGKYSTAYIA